MNVFHWQRKVKYYVILSFGTFHKLSWSLNQQFSSKRLSFSDMAIAIMIRKCQWFLDDVCTPLRIRIIPLQVIIFIFLFARYSRDTTSLLNSSASILTAYIYIDVSSQIHFLCYINYIYLVLSSSSFKVTLGLMHVLPLQKGDSY